ncbi:MAG TPA: M23 family metallopeptidase [Pyrinomonadaceae bacterium]
MDTAARIIFGAFMAFLLLGAILIFPSIAGFWGSGYQIVSAVIVIVTWGVLTGLLIRAAMLAFPIAVNNGGDFDRMLTWASRLFLIIAIHSVVTGLGLAFLAFVGCGCFWLPNLYHWVGLISAVLGFLMYFLLPWIAGTDESRSHKLFTKIFVPALVVTIWGLAWLIPFLILRGNINVEDYKWKGVGPAPVYKLPVPGGERSWVIQGNNSGSNHSGVQQYAWDFRRPCGSPVLAARSGTIVTDPNKTRDNLTEMGSDKPNNFITIQHDGTDKTFGRYLHIETGSIVKRSGHVNQGDVIAKVGSVGKSLTGHIHFVVEDSSGNSLAIKFSDVSDDDGIPRTFHSYKSGNSYVP